MIDDVARRDVLAATLDLRTQKTTPSAGQLADWVAGRRALRGEPSPFAGPPPWHGVEDVLTELESAGLVEVGGDESPATVRGGVDRTADHDGERWVAITDAGVRHLQH